jgi:pimeloyl-ACP methyl ester carboxylesterase
MFLPHCTPLTAPGSQPTHWLVVLHGIFGRGGNWRGFARKLCEEKKNWGVLLIDLRMHGKSMDAPPPHHLQACAEDLLALIDEQAKSGRRVAAVLGHSFGGKVALEMRRLRPGLPMLWIIDSSPSTRPGAMEDEDNSVVSVLRMLTNFPNSFASREAFVTEVEQHGFATNLALWLAMNLEREAEGYRLSLQPPALRDLLADYFERDLWPVLEAGGEKIHFVRATRGSALSNEDESRLIAMSTRAPVCVHSLEGGHWLHVDALEPLVALVASTLS